MMCTVEAPLPAGLFNFARETGKATFEQLFFVTLIIIPHHPEDFLF